MNITDILTNRVSIANLTKPAPNSEQLSLLFKAAGRAADHASLQPYRFLVVQNDGLKALGDAFCHSSIKEDSSLSAAQLERISSLPLRAPMVVVAIACCQKHPKVPEIEQIITAGAAVQNMITAAYGIGLGAYWRTGELAYKQGVKEALGLSDNEHIVGFVYLGTPGVQGRPLTDKDRTVVVAHWP